MLGPVRPATAAEAATNALFESICDGSIAPGTHLRLQELAERLQLSVMPIREAILRLAAMELVDVEPHKGARVRPISLKDLQDTYATRSVLEGTAIRLASQRFTAKDEDLARTSLDARTHYLKQGEHKLARDAHERFHFTLYEACDNLWLLRSILPPWRNSERYRLESFRRPEVANRRSTEHNEILEALVRCDADLAERRLVGHLKSSMDLVVESLSARPGGDPSSKKLRGAPAGGGCAVETEM